MKKIIAVFALLSILFLQSCTSQLEPGEIKGDTHTLNGTIEYVNGNEDKKYFYEPEMDIYYSLIDCKDFLDAAGNEITIDDFAVDCNVTATFIYFKNPIIGWWIDSIQKVS